MRRRSACIPVLLLATACVLAAGCEGLTKKLPGMKPPVTADTTRAPGVPPPGEGLVTTATAQSVEATARKVRSALQASAATLVTEINYAHSATASAADSLRPMRLFIFGNPALGTPLMQDVRTVGLDLPQKILVWQGASGDSTRITYNAPSYLAARHDFDGDGAVLGRMSGALTALVTQAAGHAPDTLSFNADSIAAGDGLALKVSDFDFKKTFQRLRGAVQANPQLRVLASVDHAKNAASVGDSLRPTRLLLFGRPNAAGTLPMQQTPTMGIDLPQKMLVYESDDRDVLVAYNEPAYLARRHQAADTTGLSRVAQTLSQLAFRATSDEEEVEQLRESEHNSSGITY